MAIFQRTPKHIEKEIREFYSFLETSYPHSLQEVHINFTMKKAEASFDGRCTSDRQGPNYHSVKISVGYGRAGELYELQKVKWILAHEYKHVLQITPNIQKFGDGTYDVEKDADAFADALVGPRPPIKFTKPQWLKDLQAKERGTK